LDNDATGDEVGAGTGAEVGLATGDEVGVATGDEVGVPDPIVISKVIVDPAGPIFEIVTSVSIIFPFWYAFVFGYVDPDEIPLGPMEFTPPAWNASPLSPLLKPLSKPCVPSACNNATL